MLPNVIEIKQNRKSSATSLFRGGYEQTSNIIIDNHLLLPKYKEEEQAIKLKENEIDVLNIVNTHIDTTSFIETHVKLIEKWNRITPCIIEGKRLVIDRRTWIAKNGITLEYASDTMGYPMNPMGRTGARGRGALWRNYRLAVYMLNTYIYKIFNLGWGPNHEINVVLTRWKKNKEIGLKPTNQQNKYKTVDGHKVLEFLACRDLVYGEWKLPGVFNLLILFNLIFIIQLVSH